MERKIRELAEAEARLAAAAAQVSSRAVCLSHRDGGASTLVPCIPTSLLRALPSALPHATFTSAAACTATPTTSPLPPPLPHPPLPHRQRTPSLLQAAPPPPPRR